MLKKWSRRNREEHNNQSKEAFPRIGFVMSCFCPITTLIEPSIIPSTYIFSLKEARHKMLQMKPEASAFSDSRNSFKSIKITRRKRKSTRDGSENDIWQVQNRDFVYGPGLAAWGWGTRQDPDWDNFAHRDLSADRLPCLVRILGNPALLGQQRSFPTLVKTTPASATGHLWSANIISLL